jgi:3-oxoacyl-[acyl-carrier-protein] synthase III
MSSVDNFDLNPFSINTIEIELGERRIDMKERYFGDSRLLSRTGIEYVYETDKDASWLGVSAASRIQDTDRAKVQCLIVISQSQTRMLPGLSYEIHSKLGLPANCLCIDLLQGCAGFIHGLILASKIVKPENHVLIICTDTYRKKIQPGDRSVDAIFSDAASATLVTADKSTVILGELHHTDGKGIEYLYQNQNENGSKGFLHMSGGDVFLFTKRIVEPQIRLLLDMTKIDESSVDLLVPHQASQLVLETLDSKFPKVGKFVNLVGETGNTVSSSIPIALKQHLTAFNESTTVLSGFGVGLACSSIVLKPCPK